VFINVEYRVWRQHKSYSCNVSMSYSTRQHLEFRLPTMQLVDEPGSAPKAILKG